MEKLNILIDESYFPECNQGSGSSDEEQNSLALLEGLLKEAQEKKKLLIDVEKRILNEFGREPFNDSKLMDLHLDVLDELLDVKNIINRIQKEIDKIECGEEIFDWDIIHDTSTSTNGEIQIEESVENSGGSGLDNIFQFGETLIQEENNETLERRKKNRW